jgi:hypothetical protein
MHWLGPISRELSTLRLRLGNNIFAYNKDLHFVFEIEIILSRLCHNL